MFQILSRCQNRFEWDHAEIARKKAQKEAEDREHAAYHAIDWHDFVIVETIDFGGPSEDDQVHTFFFPPRDASAVTHFHNLSRP